MKLNIQEEVGPYLMDEQNKIPDSHLEKVCKRSSGPSACRYIALTPIGYVCTKNTPIAKYIDLEVQGNPKWRAKGNNCDGFGNINYAKKQEDREGNQVPSKSDEEGNSSSS